MRVALLLLLAATATAAAGVGGGADAPLGRALLQVAAIAGVSTAYCLCFAFPALLLAAAESAIQRPCLLASLLLAPPPMPLQSSAGSQGSSPGSSSSSAMPQATAYFPLTDRNLSSAYPAGRYQGQGRNLGWEDDPSFGQVMACDEVRAPACAS